MPSISGLGPAIRAVLTATGLDSATLDLGFSQTIDDRWTVMGDVAWQNWAAFELWR